jgi:ClpP class serine protease
MLYFLRDEDAQALKRARTSGFTFNATQYSEFAAHTLAAVSGTPRNLRIAGDVAEIRVEGILTPKPDIYAWYFGGGNTTYEQIQQAISMVESDTTIKRVNFYFDSPGGTVQGFHDTIASMQAMKKPTLAVVAYACSAAYGLATQCKKIEATNAAVEVGSVGVVRGYFVDENVVEITNTESPNKRPDPTTDEGKSVIKAELDAVYDLFANVIAIGRETNVKDVTENYGRGGVLLAGEAKKRGMIDRVAKPALRAPTVSESTDATAADGGAQTRKKTMTEAELRAQHPELFAAVFNKGKEQGLTEGRTEGTAAERKRVSAHLKMAKATGATDIAHAAISDGKSVLDEDVHADYSAAAMNRNAIAARQVEAETVEVATQGTKAPSVVTKDIGDLMADAMGLPPVRA